MAQPPGPTAFALQVAHKSDPGLDPEKQLNEDAVAWAEVPAGYLLVVCDGMGGHASGREASNKAIETIVREMQAPTTAPGASLKHAIESAGRAVYQIGGPPHHRLRPGSTCVALLVHAAGIEVAHVGDSRGYMARGGKTYPITRDHSMVQQMVDAGVLKPDEAAGHPDANKITRALGMAPDVEVELRPSPILHERGDLLLLATDGLCDLVTTDEINAVLQQAMQTRGLTFACDQLVALANARGGHDNITVLIAQVSAPIEPYRPTIPEMVAAAAMPGAVPPAPPDGAPAAVPTAPEALPMQPPAPAATVPEIPTIPDAGPGEVGPAPTIIDDAPPASDAASSSGAKSGLLVLGIVLFLLGAGIAAASFAWALHSGSSSETDSSNASAPSVVAPSGGAASSSSAR